MLRYTVALLSWLLVGVGPSLAADDSGDDSAEVTNVLAKVRMVKSDAYNTTHHVQVYGIIEAGKRVELRSEIAGKVALVQANDGQLVKKGDVILAMDMSNSREELTYAQAMLKQRKVELKATQTLSKSGYKGELALEAARALMAQAESQLKLAKSMLNKHLIRAPFAGRVDYIGVESGDYVKAGDKLLATITATDSLTAVGYLPEVDSNLIDTGATATVTMLDGLKLYGVVKFVSQVATPDVRAYRVEVDIPKPERGVYDGKTATIRLNGAEVMVHKIPASALALSESGQVGVKVLDDNNVAEFKPVTVISDENGMMEVAGLPEHIKLVTLGQAFVSSGTQVEVSTEESQTP